MIKFPPHRPSARVSAGFSLVEVALALGIAAFALVAIFGLLPVGINSNRAAAEQTATVNMTTAIVTDLRVTTNVANASSPSFGIVIPTSTPGYPTIGNGSPTILYLDESGGRLDGNGKSLTAFNSRYRATINFAVPPAGQRTATLAQVILSWPSPPLPQNAAGSVTTFIALDRN